MISSLISLIFKSVVEYVLNGKFESNVRECVFVLACRCLCVVKLTEGMA